MSIIAIPRILQDKLTPEGAEALIEIINKAEEQSKDHTVEVVEERFERRIAQLDTKIEQVKAELIKWMFIFWIGQVGVITGILFAFFRK